MEIISEPLEPLPPEEIERGRLKIAEGYPLPESRLTFKPDEWNDMYRNNAVVIPDGSHTITDHPGHDPSRLHLFDPAYTAENPMPADEAQIQRWIRLGVLMDAEGRRPVFDQANRPLHPRAPQMLTTLGMYTGTGFFRHHGPNLVGNFGLRLLRNEVAYYVTVAVERGESRLRISLPGGHAETGETAEEAAVIEFAQETGIDLHQLGRIGISAQVITPPHPFWKNTLHAFTLEQYLFAQSEEDPGLDGLVLRTRDSNEVKQLQLMSFEEIQRHPDFLGAHRKQVAKNEARLRGK